MNYKILLKLAAIPAISSSLSATCLLTGFAFQAQATSSSPTQDFCSLPQTSELDSPNLQSLLHRKSSLLVASSRNVVSDKFAADFTEAESDAAVALFGCDCPACMNVLQQLQRQSLTPKGEGHCMKNLARRVTPEKAQEILKNLETGTLKNNP